MLGLALRLLIGAGLLYYLLRKVETAQWADLLAGAATGGVPWLSGGLAATLGGLLSGAWRWQYILKAQGIRFSAWQTTRIFFIGQFFNAFMLGACGGDMARAYYAARGRTGKKAEAAATIFVDRGIGLFMTIVFACVMVAARLRVFVDYEGPREAGLIMIVFLVLSLAGLAALFRQHAFEHIALFRRLENGMRIGPLIRRAYDAFYLYRHHPRVMAAALALSVVNLVLLTLACFCFGRALHIEVALADYFTLFPVISVLAAIPITPGGLGVRENLFVSLFGAVLVSPPHAVLLSLAVYAGGLFWSACGGVLYLAYAAEQGRPS